MSENAPTIWGYDERSYALYVNRQGQYQWRYIDHRDGQPDIVSPLFKSVEEARHWAENPTVVVTKKGEPEWRKVEP